MEENLPNKIDDTYDSFEVVKVSTSPQIKINSQDKMIKSIEEYKNFLSENNRHPSTVSKNDKERKLAKKIENIKMKIKKEEIPTDIIETISSITKRKSHIEKLDEYISFVKENNRIPSRKNGEYEIKLLNFRVTQQTLLAKNKIENLDESTLSKIGVIINHRSLINMDLKMKKRSLKKNEDPELGESK